MLLIEKILTLHACDIFQSTPESELIELAGILEETYLEPDVCLFTKGSMGNCMYFIFKGRVRIHDGEHTLAILEENDIVGELAILDAESRSASATTLEECILLKLEQEPFYDIMMNNAEVLRGILKTLCRRLRTMDERSAKAPAVALPAVQPLS
ncbi:Cyclic nucleotide-binding domain-containing protein [Pontibacter ummariensis]|uniref:Cyclic nucleotide-binding domain-containing protein n=1 Tax=Pontibacter ummariensis TaxID=1610492 RepID=A0A239D872_9BACT|nr:cyclic nucleotide-binding domain-containing protein [Pontibacter ummariensis]PRY14296.1 Cyclic nucleotide-binding domain-containing protein [Pontibacter ummariensis]SNS28479.1 Cyclic nucleotide-binding domain-containing protein [Pontibacter ummariensis]